MTIRAAAQAFVRPVLGLPNAPVLVLCDPQNRDAAQQRKPMGPRTFDYLTSCMTDAGLYGGDFQFVALCPPIPEEAEKSVSKTWDFVKAHLDGLDQLIAQRNPRLIVPVGSLALRAVMGKATAITKARGVVSYKDDRVVFPILSPGQVLKVPDHAPTFRADLATLAKLIQGDFDETAVRGEGASYEYVDDLTEMLDDKPKFLAVDTEFRGGLQWYRPAVKAITVQLCPKPGVTKIAIIDPEYRRRWLGDTSGMRGTMRLRGQLARLLEDKTIPKVGHNFKIDHHVLRQEGMDVQGWAHDTLLLAFANDENMMSKALSDCVKRWVPAMAGYSDQFDALIDKAHMEDVPPEDEFDAFGNLVRPGMRSYAGGDPDAVFRLAQVLVPELRKDPLQYNCYRRIMIPGITAFARTVERVGQVVDRTYLRQLEGEIREWTDKEYDRLVRMIPPRVRQRQLALAAEKKMTPEKALSFTRDDFMRDVLFSRDGFKLKPRVWTDSTVHLPNGHPDKIPSVSTKTHMPYFESEAGAAGEFVRGYIQLSKAEKLLSTYIGEEARGTGFWKYISDEGRIHPSYALHKTNTGRTASSDPNGQNIPKRGDFAKTYRKAYRASPGYRRVDCDLSQIELRLVAIMANEPEMLRVYANDGDIHTETGMATSKMGGNEWAMLDEDDQDLRRFKAKAVNFGFVYGMGWRGFKAYAKTQYGVDYTDQEAQETRMLYFAKYGCLPDWHEEMKEFAHKHGHVRGLHGRLRRLPSIRSNDESNVAMAERQAVNAPIQGLGSDLGVIAMSILERHADPEIVRPVGFIHDCLACEAREGYEEDAAKAIVWIMENLPLERYFGLQLPIPIKADAEVETLMEDGTLKMTKRKNLVPEVPWFWKDEVEEEFEGFMNQTGCAAFAPYEPLGCRVPILMG